MNVKIRMADAPYNTIDRKGTNQFTCYGEMFVVTRGCGCNANKYRATHLKTGVAVPEVVQSRAKDVPAAAKKRIRTAGRKRLMSALQKAFATIKGAEMC